MGKLRGRVYRVDVFFFLDVVKMRVFVMCYSKIEVIRGYSSDFI